MSQTEEDFLASWGIGYERSRRFFPPAPLHSVESWRDRRMLLREKNRQLLSVEFFHFLPFRNIIDTLSCILSLKDQRGGFEKNLSKRIYSKIGVSVFVLFLSAVSASLAGAGSFQKAPSLSGHALKLKLRADNLLRQGRTREAASLYERSLSFQSSAAVYFNLAIACYEMKDFKATRRCLENVLALDPGDVEAQYNLGCIEICEGNLEAARRSFQAARKAVSRDPLFLPIVEKGIQFTEDVEKMEPAAKEVILLLLRQMPPLSLSEAS